MTIRAGEHQHVKVEVGVAGAMAQVAAAYVLGQIDRDEMERRLMAIRGDAEKIHLQIERRVES